MRKRYVELSCKERESLKTIKLSSKNRRESLRAHAMLLSDKGYDVDSLCKIFEVRKPAMYCWMNRWESEGTDGLLDKCGRGRKRNLTKSEEKK